MGGNAPSKQTYNYSIPISEPKEGESAIHRSPDYADSLLTIPKGGWTTAQQLY